MVVKMRQLLLTLCLAHGVVSATTSGAHFDEESQIQTLASHTKQVSEVDTNTLSGILPELVRRQEQLQDMLPQINVSSSIAKVAGDMNEMSTLADLLQESVRADLEQALKDVVNMSQTKSITEALQSVSGRFSDSPVDLLRKRFKWVDDMIKKTDSTKESSNQEIVDGFFISVAANLNGWNFISHWAGVILPRGLLAKLAGGISLEFSFLYDVIKRKTRKCLTISMDRSSYGVARSFKDTSFAIGPMKFGNRPGWAWGTQLNVNSNLLPRMMRTGQFFAEAEFTWDLPPQFVAGAVIWCMPGIIGCDPRIVEENEKWYRFIQDIHPFATYTTCVK